LSEAKSGAVPRFATLNAGYSGHKHLKNWAIVTGAWALVRHESVTERLHKSVRILIIAETAGPRGSAIN
jgi:hypothetical protein